MAGDDLSLVALIENLRTYQAELEAQNQELRASRADLEFALGRFAAFFASIPLAELIVDATGLILEVNQAAEQLFELTRERLRQHIFIRLIHEAHQGLVLDAFSSAWAGDRVELPEIGLRTTRGRDLVGDLHIARLPGEIGVARQLVCAVVDRTEAARQRQTLSRTLDGLRFSRMQLDERIRELSCLYDVLQLKSQRKVPIATILQQIVDRLPVALPGPADPPAGACIRLPDRTFASEHFRPTAEMLSIPFALPSGGSGQLQVAYPEADPADRETALGSGRRLLFQAIATHLARFLQHRAAEEELARSREHYRILADYSPEWEYWLGSDGRYLHLSPACETITGHPPDDFLADPGLTTQLIHPDDRAGYLAHLAEILGPGRGSWQRDEERLEFRLRTRTGEWLWIDHICTPVIGTDGRWRGRRGVNRDITARKRAEADLARVMRLYSTLSATNQAIVRHTSEETLLPVICRIIVERGGLVACAIHRRSADPAAVTEPVAASYRSALAADPNRLDPGAPLVEGAHPALQHGLSFPIRIDGRVVGCKTVHADGAEFFTPDVIRLLDEIAQDIAFAIDRFQREAARVAAEESLAAREQQLAALFRAAPIAIGLVEQRRFLQANDFFYRLTGFAPAEVLGQSARMLYFDEEEYLRVGVDKYAQIAATGIGTVETRWRHKDGGAIEVLLSSAKVSEPATAGISVFTALDITSLTQAKERLDFLAHHDPLTALPNRTLFRARLEHSLQRAARDRVGLAVMLIDLNRFRVVNESLGHSQGDLLLHQVATSLTEAVRPGDTLARLAGDEFGLVMEDLEDPLDATEMARHLLELCAMPRTVNDQELLLTASIGIGVYPTDGTDAETLLRHADVALKRAKQQGPHLFQFYETAMEEEALQRLRIESGLRQARAAGELSLHFQPQVRLADGCLIGAEALLRWTSKELGSIPPNQFIPLAEEMGLIGEIGAWVIEQACIQMAAWDHHGWHLPRMAINLSIRQLEMGALATQIRQILERTGITPGRLELEITESTIMRQAKVSLAVLDDLQTLGLRLAIDDFGTGYSSLAYLKRLPLQQLKVDKSFVDDLLADVNSLAIAQTILALGNSLKLEVLAEGVEDAEQAALLRREGFALAQGYHFDRPLPADDFARRWLRPGSPSPSRPDLGPG